MLLNGKKSQLRKLKSQVSALADDALPENEKEALISELKKNPELQKSWYRYHLIKSVLQKKNGKLVLAQANTLSKRVQAELAKIEITSQTAEFDTPVINLATEKKRVS